MHQRHPYHLVDPSPWPFGAALSAFVFLIGGVLYMHSYQKGSFVLSFGFLLLLLTMALWWRDVIREATFEGQHTKIVKHGLRYGFLLFIVSEVMFFFGFFWAFFHSSLSPAIEIGGKWPPVGLEVLDPWKIPLANTIILLSSGATLTWSFYGILAQNRKEAITGLVLTVLLAALFTGFQAYEYINAPFSISDGIYGSTFYMTTGLHGLHVLIGTIFLTVCLIRLWNYHFTKKSHLGFEAAVWYWHFVDVVWIFLFISIYWWGGS
uniref:Cytochrome c oxidase subunit 3 n=1 Tax=Glaucocystis nostochinearum TaxID=38271 RepID=E9P6D5_9EUKA|nr:cytochrome c oxidase subunit 3 [Glaucocystis nostochinearum]ADW83119.1 cytochrome c oxidase subunit 3 [Glaucocystis nostochinearum]